MKNIKKVFSLCLVLIMLSTCLAGCGTNNAGTTGDNALNELGTDTKNAVNDAGDVAKDVVDGVEDVAEGTGNLVTGKGFNTYNDAHDYFLEQMGTGNNAAKYEVRNESQDLMEYQSGSKGYRFELYDTANDTNGTRVGEYYVDSATGLIYSKNEESGDITQYSGTLNSRDTSNAKTTKTTKGNTTSSTNTVQ